MWIARVSAASLAEATSMSCMSWLTVSFWPLTSPTLPSQIASALAGTTATSSSRAFLRTTSAFSILIVLATRRWASGWRVHSTTWPSIVCSDAEGTTSCGGGGGGNVSRLPATGAATAEAGTSATNSTTARTVAVRRRTMVGVASMTGLRGSSVGIPLEYDRGGSQTTQR